MKYREIGREYPDLKADFDGYQLSVICVETDDIEMIEDMFARLNEAATLTAPEKRNAYPGPMPAAIRKLANEPFFVSSLPFRNTRYRHYDLAVKFLLAEHCKKILDTKKVYLDQFVKEFENRSRNKMPACFDCAKATVNLMDAVFTENDPLLRQVGMVTVYYHLIRIAHAEGWESKVTRRKLLEFDKSRQENRLRAEDDLGAADYKLMEFDRYSQSPNDSHAVKLRLQILMEEVFGKIVRIESL